MCIFYGIYSMHDHAQRNRPKPGVGVTEKTFSVALFSEFFIIIKTHVWYWISRYIWQVSPQLSCGDTCQIWMWFRECNKIEKSTHREINERGFSTPTPDDICTHAGKNMLCNQNISYAIIRLVVKTWHTIMCNMPSGSWLVHYIIK